MTNKLAAIKIPDSNVICTGLEALPRYEVTHFDGHSVAYLTFDGFLKWFNAALITRLKAKKNVTILCDGMPRQGKSTIMMHILQRHGLTKEEMLNAVCFSMDEFRTRSRSMPYGNADSWQFAIYDEAGVGFYRKEWMTDFAKEMNKWFQISGIKQAITWFNLPKYSILNKETFSNFVWMRIWVPETGRAEVSICEPKKWQENWFKPYLAFQYPKLEGAFWDTYEQKKIGFLEKPDIAKKAKDERSRYGDRFAVLTEYVADHKWMTKTEICDLVGLELSALSHYLTMHRKE